MEDRVCPYYGDVYDNKRVHGNVISITVNSCSLFTSQQIPLAREKINCKKFHVDVKCDDILYGLINQPGATEHLIIS